MNFPANESVSINFRFEFNNLFGEILNWCGPDPTPGSPNLASGCYGLRPTLRAQRCYALNVFFPGWNRYPKKKITQKIELVTWHWASNISIYVFVPYIIADVTGSMWRYWLNFFSDFYFFGKKLSQYDDIEPVRCPELVRCHWASTMTLSQYDDTDSTVRPTFLVGPSEMKENDSFYHPQNSPWQQSFWFLSSDYIRTLENWASKEIWDGTQNEVDWVQKDSMIYGCL